MGCQSTSGAVPTSSCSSLAELVHASLKRLAALPDQLADLLQHGSCLLGQPVPQGLAIFGVFFLLNCWRYNVIIIFMVVDIVILILFFIFIIVVL